MQQGFYFYDEIFGDEHKKQNLAALETNTRKIKSNIDKYTTGTLISV